MTRFPSLCLVLLVGACSDSAQVLVPPDSGTLDAAVDVVADVSTVDAPVEATAPDASDASDDVVQTGCTTGFELCNGNCVDVTTYQTDAKNCGFCGHDCLGNACTTGLCAADLIGTNLPNPTTLAVDSSNVYFATVGDGSSTAGEIYECPVTGCPGNLTAMTSGLNNPETIAVDATKVYWDNTGDLATANGSVMSCPITGCGANNASRKTLAKNRQFVLGLAVDSSNVYFGVWGASPYYGNGSIDVCPLTGCSGTPPKVLTGQSKPAFVSLDGTNLFMATMGGGSGIPSIESGPLPGPSAGTQLYAGNAIQDQISGFAIYANTMYFTDGFAATVLMCAETGCPTTIPIFASNTSNPFSIAVDAKGAYWLDDAGIEYCALPACGSPTLLATSANFPTNLAINGSFVYWVEQDNSGTAGQVLRVPR